MEILDRVKIQKEIEEKKKKKKMLFKRIRSLATCENREQQKVTSFIIWCQKMKRFIV